jgi:hypothetical protein
MNWIIRKILKSYLEGWMCGCGDIYPDYNHLCDCGSKAINPMFHNKYIPDSDKKPFSEIFRILFSYLDQYEITYKIADDLDYNVGYLLTIVQEECEKKAEKKLKN